MTKWLTFHDPKWLNLKRPLTLYSQIVIKTVPVSSMEIAEAVKQAGGFTNCSREAMRYRLEDLDLLINLTGK